MIEVTNCWTYSFSLPITTQIVKNQSSFSRQQDNLSSNSDQKSCVKENYERIIEIRGDINDESIFKLKLKEIIEESFSIQIQSYDLILLPGSSIINLQLPQKIITSKSVLNHFKQIAQSCLNLYQITIFSLDSAHRDNLYLLQDKFAFEQVQSQILFIAKKSEMLQQIITFFKNLIQLAPKPQKKKIQIETQILEFDLSKQQKIDDVIKSVHLLVAKEEEINIKVRISDKCLIIIAGQPEIVQMCKNHIMGSLNPSSVFETTSKKYRINEEEMKILKKNKVLDMCKDIYKCNFEVKKCNVIRSYKIYDNSYAYLLVNSSILSLPNQAVLILPQNFIKEMRQFQDSVHILKNYFFYNTPEDKSIKEGIKQFIGLYVESQIEIGVVIEESNREVFITEIVEIIYSQENKMIKIYFLERNDEQLGISAFENAVVSQKKYYAMVNGIKKYYPTTICKQIEQGISNDWDRLLITHQQLKITKITHRYDDKQENITHLNTGYTNFVQIQGNKLVVFVEKQYFRINKNEIKQQGLTFAVFEINFLTKMQINLITNKTSDIGFEMVKKNKKDVNFQPQKTEFELTIKYLDQESIDQIWQNLKNQLQNYRIVKKFSIQILFETQIQEIQNWCRLNKVQIARKGKQLEAWTYNQGRINNLQKLVKIHTRKHAMSKIQYPKCWEQDENDQNILKNVEKDSDQFQEVQTQFKVGEIKELQRVQNKILFEKYNSERAYLRQLNGGTVRELMLYHGTRANPPELIYADRDQSFNINYAKQGWYGKGIYFAKRSEYSNDYCYNNGTNKQMFYCLVLVGNSQVWNSSQQFNTNYRDAAKKIRYQSVVNTSAEDIVVVFKNRRAYPLYLITY